MEQEIEKNRLPAVFFYTKSSLGGSVFQKLARSYDNHMNLTKDFVSMSQRMLGWAKKQSGFSPDFLTFYKSFAQGKCCVCGKRLVVISRSVTGSGTEYRFFCKHTFNIVSLEEAKGLGRGHSHSRVGINTEVVHDVAIEFEGDRIAKEASEILAVKTLAHYYKPDLSVFKSDIQNSPYDVIGESADKTSIEYFQVTKLEDSNFFRTLNSNKEIKTVLPELQSLTKKAIQRKINFSPYERKKIVLIIDADPGVLEGLVGGIKSGLSELLIEASFKEVWISGSTRELTHRIF